MGTRPKSVPKILILTGPTASGKTQVAREISKRLPAEIISCDSMQVYRGMSIITQAPAQGTVPARGLSPERRPVGPVHLTAFLDPSSEYSAAMFREEATRLVRQISKRKKTPLIVGGTGLYLRALLDGLFTAQTGEPVKDAALRERLLREEETRGDGHLHARLKEADPASAARVHPHDLRRVVRALEVFILTKKPLSRQRQNRKGIRKSFPHRIFLLERDRVDLYRRINDRVDRMIREGLVEEVKKLMKRKLSQTARMALGIREIRSYLEGRCTLEQAVELLKKNTRNYAKRQLSWFRHEQGVEPITVAPDEPSAQIAFRILAKFNMG